jgi:hypothetical protein
MRQKSTGSLAERRKIDSVDWLERLDGFGALVKGISSSVIILWVRAA